MQIVVKTAAGSKTVSPSVYANEKELESLLIQYPDLLNTEANVKLAFVGSQVSLRDCGVIDVLFVTSDGLPVIVEVKLGKNSESRRDVVAQAIDYLSSLTELTVDELDVLVGNKLEEGIRQLCLDDEDAFDETWEAVGKNLRDGRARLIVVVDSAPLSLERIFRFLARKSDLDVRLVTVQAYRDTKAGDGDEILVPRLLVNPTDEAKPGGTASGPRKTLEELLEFCENQAALAYFNARLTMERNSHRDSLAYRENGKIHWYVGPTKSGALVTQIDRFQDDESFWKNGLRKPEISTQKRGNMRFHLTEASDFDFFVKSVENAAAPKPWFKE